MRATCPHLMMKYPNKQNGEYQAAVLQRRKANFEAQVESGFRHVIDSRKDLLEELRSRKIQKLSYGDATAILEKLPIQ